MGDSSIRRNRNKRGKIDNATLVNQKDRINNTRDKGSRGKNVHAAFNFHGERMERLGQRWLWVLLVYFIAFFPLFLQVVLSAGSLSSLHIMKAPTHFTPTDGTSRCNIMGSFASQIKARGSMPSPSLLPPHAFLLKMSHDQEPKHVFPLPEFFNGTYLRKDCKSRVFRRLQIALAIRN